MGDPKTVLEGSVKYRDKKKWKSRWAVVSKLSPVADCLHIQLYRDSKERCKNGPTKASLSLEEFLGLETGFTLDKESNTLALVCSELVVVLAFDSRELLIQWQVKIRANLVEEQQFLVQIAHVPVKSKLPCGPARLHLQDHTFCLVNGVPPRLLGTWPIKELRRFGVVEGKFCFEGGSLCGKGEGLHVLLTNQSEELAQAMDLASKGKLQGKRKTLSRKNSVLETSTRMPLHKRCHRDSRKSESGRPLLSSESECSTCDACSDVLRDDFTTYSCSSAPSLKASSCRIHYRWPSCLSRWGQSSTTTASDVDSVDTVSVILSDFHGSSHSSTMSKSNGQSLSCLCDTQGTWPFNQCTKCGRQFYGRSSLQTCKGSKPCSSPEPAPTENVSNGFSPQWTMDSLIGTQLPSKKDSVYQLMNPPPDRASLCSHASHSSSTSASSDSEYSVPKHFLEALYDKPKNMQFSLNGFANSKTTQDYKHTSNNASEKLPPPKQENCVLCPCHEPSKNLMSASGYWENPAAFQQDCACWKQLDMTNVAQDKNCFQDKQTNCPCWNKLSMSVRNEVDIRVVNGKCKSANPSPSSSPKKGKYGTSSATLRPTVNSELDGDLTCTCGKGNPYANYAVPRSTFSHFTDVPSIPSSISEVKDGKIHSTPAEDYDVPKKFSDMFSNCDMTQKHSPMKTAVNAPSCSCMSACKIVQNFELFKMASNHSHKHNGPGEMLQMCACQRVMLWAGNLVPCLGSQRATVETGWQCAKSMTSETAKCSRSWIGQHSGAICTEPPRTAEVVMMNGKVKHVLRESSLDFSPDTFSDDTKHLLRPRANTVSYSFSSTNQLDSRSTNYANIELPASKDEDKVVILSDDSCLANYANIEFAESLPLYENSNSVLSRMESDKSEAVTNKPPLPPRTQSNVGKNFSNNLDEYKVKAPPPVNVSPKRTISKQANGSAYEMMCYDKVSSCRQKDEDYLMMQPLFIKEETPLSTHITENEIKCHESGTSNMIADNNEGSEAKVTLPLRPFMPYSFPISENIVSNSSELSQVFSRKKQLMNEDIHLKAMRSNSFSELKKKVLTRKRSSSIDGKNNGYSSKDSGVESVPASPVGSPRPSLQRKNSLFSKLNLRSKEKSMSTNEIDVPAPLSNGSSCVLNNALKNSCHRSADCLKLSEEFANSDEDLNSDNSDFFLQKESSSVASMKRSTSVPCRPAMPLATPESPSIASKTVIELNDLNKDVVQNVTEGSEDSQELATRKYSFDSHERARQKVPPNIDSTCENICSQEGLNESDTVKELRGVLRRTHLHPSERSLVIENYRSNTSSCSSSDISDYMESLSFISRSSSSSSGSTSSADYMRSEDMPCMSRNAPRPPPKSGTAVGTNNISIPGAHQVRPPSTDPDSTIRSVRHRIPNDTSDSSSCGTSSNGSFLESAYLRGQDELTIHRPQPQARSKRDSRSSTSSTSSLSTSPSVTDYSSSTSSSPPCQNALTGKQVVSRRSETKPEVPVPPSVKMDKDRT